MGNETSLINATCAILFYIQVKVAPDQYSFSDFVSYKHLTKYT